MKNNIYKIAFYVWIVFILISTSYPRISISDEHIIGLDKLAHIFLYFIFAFLFLKKQSIITLKHLKHLIIMSFLIPLGDELHQLFIPGRNFSLYDIVADIIGFYIIISVTYFTKFHSQNRN